MAQIDTYQKRKRMPVGAPVVPLPTETPEIKSRTELFGIAGTLAFNKAMQFAIRERDNELTNFEGIATEGYNRFLGEIANDPIPSSYSEKYKEFIKTIQPDFIKNPETRRIARNWLIKKGGVWERQIQYMALGRSEQNTRDAIDLAAYNAIKLRDPDIINRAITRGVQNGVIGEDAGSLIMEKAHRGILLGQIEDEAQEISESQGYEQAVKWVMDQKIELDERNSIASTIKRTAANKQLEYDAYVEKTEQDFYSKYDKEQLSTNEIEASNIPVSKKLMWKRLVDAQAEARLKGAKTTNEALIAMRYSIAGIAQGTQSREDSLNVLIQYKEQLSPTDSKAFIKEIFGEHDTKNAFWNREAQDYMERQIMEVSSLTGIRYGSGEQIALSAKALLAYDDAKKKAAAEGKPLKGRELLELAHETMLPFRKKVKPLMPGEKLPETLGGRKVSPEYKPPKPPPTKKPEKKEGEFVVEKYPKPKSVEEFENTFRHISDRDERRRYYDKWADEVYK